MDVNSTEISVDMGCFTGNDMHYMFFSCQFDGDISHASTPRIGRDREEWYFGSTKAWTRNVSE